MKQSRYAVEKYLIEVGGDGHSIFTPNSLVNMGFTEAFVKTHTFTEKSGKSYKEQIFVGGKKVNELTGVYALSFIYAIAEDMGLDVSRAREKSGRGFQAQVLASLIQDALKSQAVQEVGQV